MSAGRSKARAPDLGAMAYRLFDSLRACGRSRAPLRAAALALALWGCAATTPPPQFSPVSPADPTAPEAATPPPSPSLAAESRTTYTCPMHPEVEARGPGSCPLCAMPLVKKPGEKKEPAR